MKTNTIFEAVAVDKPVSHEYEVCQRSIYYRMFKYAQAHAMYAHTRTHNVGEWQADSATRCANTIRFGRQIE